MCCLYLLRMILQLQTSQSSFLSMLSVILTSQETLWWIEILTLSLTFDEKYARFRWLNSVSLLLIILKLTVKVKSWIKLLKTIWESILSKIKKYESSYYLLLNLFITTVRIILLKWVQIDYYTDSIVKFTLTLQTILSRKKYQLQKIILRNFTNYSRICI